MKKITTIFFAFLAVYSLHAAYAKIDFDGRAQGIKLKALEGLTKIRKIHPPWAKNQKKSYLCMETKGGLSKSWQTFTIGFIPDKDGAVSMMLRGNAKKRPTADWIAYDKFIITGAELKNPSFEEVENGFPAAWSRSHYGLFTNTKNAVDGKNYIASSHNVYAAQQLKVKAGVPVKITFSAKFDQTTPGQYHPLSSVGKSLSAKSAKTNAVIKRDLTRPARIKIDIDARQFASKIINTSASKGLEIRPDEYYGPDKASYFEVIGTEDLTDEWKEYEFSFALSRATNTKLFLRSLQVKGDERWVAYDDFTFSGNGISNANPSFEKHSNGKSFSHWRSVESNVAANKPDAAHGKSYAMASFDHALLFDFYPYKVITVKFKAKNAGAAKVGTPYAYIFDKPSSYYRIYNSKAKYLPLADKGINGNTIGNSRPNIAPANKIYPVFAKPQGKASAVALEKIPFELLEESGVARNVNIRVGIPLPEKNFYNLKNFAVKNPDGKQVPAQFSAIAWWPDKSVKTVLVQFQTKLAANEKSTWYMEAGKSVVSQPVKSALSYSDKNGKITVSTGVLTATINKKKFALLSDVAVNGKKVGSFAPEGLKIVDENGKIFTASAVAPTRFAVEENGPVRLVFRVDGKFSDGKNAIADYVARIGFNANSSKVDFAISYYNTNLKTEFTDLDSYSFSFVPQSVPTALTMGGNSGKRIFQHNDQRLDVDGKITEGKNVRLAGGGEVTTAGGKLSFAIKDLWMRYPKAVNINDNRVTFELLPLTNDKKFNTDLPWYLQFPFCEGKYRAKWGMGFTEDISIDFAGSSGEQQLAALDVLPVIDRDWLFKTRVFEGTVPKNVHIFDAWNAKMEDGFQEHMEQKEQLREYGYFNCGDNFGERYRNWNNNEYDFADGLLMLFMRTGNRAIARWALKCARHQADVDIVHAYPDPLYLGANAQHSIGHTGVSYQVVNPATWTYRYDAAYIGTNGHTWADGMLHAWMYSGDAVTMDAALLLSNHLTTYIAPTFSRLGSHERTAGWSVRAILAFYRITGDRSYFNHAKRIVDIALSEQKFDKGGAWPHKLPGAHGGGHKNAYGNCPYLMGILSEMLRQYYRIDPRPEVKKSLIAVAGWLRRSHDKNVVGWSYGVSWDCKPYQKRASTGTNCLIVPGLLVGGRLEKNLENFEIGKNVIKQATEKGYRGNSKQLAIGIVYNAGTIDEFAAFIRENPEVGVYEGNSIK